MQIKQQLYFYTLDHPTKEKKPVGWGVITSVDFLRHEKNHIVYCGCVSQDIQFFSYYWHWMKFVSYLIRLTFGGAVLYLELFHFMLVNQPCKNGLENLGYRRYSRANKNRKDICEHGLSVQRIILVVLVTSNIPLCPSIPYHNYHFYCQRVETRQKEK